MQYEIYIEAKRHVVRPFEDVTDWVKELFDQPLADKAYVATGNKALCADDIRDVEAEVVKRRQGIKFFHAGNYSAKKTFANFLFPHFEDEDKEEYYDAVSEFMRVAKSTRHMIPKSSNKIELGPIGTLVFSCDSQGFLYGVVCSQDYPLKQAFDFVQDAMKLYADIPIRSALDGTDISVWTDTPEFYTDVFGIRPLAYELWQKYARPEDGSTNQRNMVMLSQ
eukprot:GEMP01061774.1.p1 GENE.GEMP01061774.1~~GEMP01061774.1.p1  ORF type:complete len:222 (+),score=52.71 GEMP01061774.1:160-825(+)